MEDLFQEFNKLSPSTRLKTMAIFIRKNAELILGEIEIKGKNSDIQVDNVDTSSIC